MTIAQDGICPGCLQKIRVYNDQKFNLDGRPHLCHIVNAKPHSGWKEIGPTIVGRELKKFTLRDKQLVLDFGDGCVLLVSADDTQRLRLTLVKADGTITE